MTATMTPACLLAQRRALAASEPWGRAGRKLGVSFALDRRGKATHVTAQLTKKLEANRERS